MDKKIIIRICIALLWFGVGIFQIAAKSMMVSGIISIAVGAVFAFDAFRYIKKN